MLCLQYTLRGIKKAEALSGAPPRQRLPITLEILLSLKKFWLSDVTPSYNGIMLWAAACVGFFGFLRVGEFTVTSLATYDPEVHLNLADSSVDSHVAPSIIGVKIKQSKTGGCYFSGQDK